MNKYDLSHVSDADLMRDLPALEAKRRAAKAALLADLAETDARGLERSLDPETRAKVRGSLEDLVEEL